MTHEQLYVVKKFKDKNCSSMVHSKTDCDIVLEKIFIL